MLGKGVREIAKTLGRSASTISRELKRNKVKKKYSPSQADNNYKKRRKNAEERKY